VAVALAGGTLVAWPRHRVAALGVALLAWNLAFGLVPAAFLDYAGTSLLRARVRRQPGAWFLLRDPNPLRNQLHYYTGQPVASPRIVGLAGQDSAAFRRWLAARLAAGDTVYTDALGRAQPFDRARLTLGDAAARLLADIPAQRIDSLPTFYGPHYLWRLSQPVKAVSVKAPAARFGYTYAYCLPCSVSAGASRSHAQPTLRASAAVKAGASR